MLLIVFIICLYLNYRLGLENFSGSINDPLAIGLIILATVMGIVVVLGFIGGISATMGSRGA